MVKRAVEMEGTVTVCPNGSTDFRNVTANTQNQGEHGVGLVKRDYLPHELGETTVDTMRQVRSDSRSPLYQIFGVLTTTCRSKRLLTRYAC
jgi:D-lactate dehydrogenase (cytochrome)